MSVSLVQWFLGASCVVCGADGATLCGQCRWQLPAADPVPAPAPLADVTALVRYEGRGRDLVRALKYRNRRSVVAELGRVMAGRAPADHDVVTWLPTTGRRRRRRGYDQARLLARAVSAAGGAPCLQLLLRVDRQAQTGRSRRDRLSGPTVAARRDVTGVVVLVDDVVTTGASLQAGARALLDAGADRVHGLTLAQTPHAMRSPSGPARR